jgi:transposase
VVKLDPVDTTRECFWCSHVNTEWEKPEERVQTCAACKRQWDQDHNAARILLKRFNAGDGNAAPEPEPTHEPPKKKRVATIIETSSAL